MSRIRVLVVEDDSIIRSCMVEALSDAGYEVDEAETGDLATKLLDEDGYRLVVTDLNMPGRFNGVDVAAYAHQHEPDLPFVFVTGRPDIRAHVFAADKIHGDDTTVPVLEPSLGRTRTGRLWVYVRDDRRFCGDAPPAAAYFYSPDRTAAHPAAHMTNFTGFLQADAYAGFEKLYGPARIKPGPIIEVAC